MWKVATLGITLALFVIAGVYTLELEDTRLAGLLLASDAPDIDEPWEDIGASAAVELPAGLEFVAFFDPDPDLAETDPARWLPVYEAMAQATTPDGWAALCREVNRELGDDRTENILSGALACSDIPAVTRKQQFAAYILQTQAYVALYANEIPGFSRGGVEGRIGHLALECQASPIFSDRSEGSPFGEVCALAGDLSFKEGDTLTTFRSLGAAYELVANHIAARDPDIDPDAGFHTTAE